jgi:hypothetical protein
MLFTDNTFIGIDYIRNTMGIWWKTENAYPLCCSLLIIYVCFLCFVLLVFALGFFQMFQKALDHSFSNVYSVHGKELPMLYM